METGGRGTGECRSLCGQGEEVRAGLTWCRTLVDTECIEIAAERGREGRTGREGENLPEGTELDHPADDGRG